MSIDPKFVELTADLHTWNPLLGTILLEVNIGRDLGALIKGLKYFYKIPAPTIIVEKTKYMYK